MKDGNRRLFPLNVPDTGGSLVFSLVGYVSQERVSGSESTVHVGLTADVKQLGEVATALGPTASRDQMGTARLRSGETSVITALSPPPAGVLIIRTSGASGASANIQMWEAGTISNRQPLLVVDGIPIFNSSVGNVTPLTRAQAKTDEAGRFAYFYTTQAGYYSLDLNIVNGAFAPVADALTYLKTQAIPAEALNRNGDQADALSALNPIRAENDAGFGPGAYADYVMTDFAAGEVLNKVARQTPAAALLKEILTEKHLRFIGQFESFHDMRRTNNIVGIPKKNPASTSVPQRLLYLQSEVNTTPNVPKPIPGVFIEPPCKHLVSQGFTGSESGCPTAGSLISVYSTSGNTPDSAPFSRGRSIDKIAVCQILTSILCAMQFIAHREPGFLVVTGSMSYHCHQFIDLSIV